MPQLAIAREFLAEYAKLERPVRQAVQVAISKFQQHTHAGIHLERVNHARDPRVRTIRIDKFWRGIVLAPDQGDVYCLLTVLPHDDAYAYCASRRFTVNQALGVLESRDELQLETIEPALRKTADAEDRRLFEGIKDSDLKRLGVDEQVLPVILSLSWAVHLLDSDLPVTGLDDITDTLFGYGSPMHGRRPIIQRFPDREAELDCLVTQVRAWLANGVEPHAIGIAARRNALAGTAKERLKAYGITAVSPGAKTGGVRGGSMHGMKGLEFRCVAVIGGDEGLVPLTAALPERSEDPVAHEQALQRERCLLFVACTRARDALYVSHAGAPSPFLPR